MYLGIDLGTSELKLLLLDEQHHIVASLGEPLTVSRPHRLWSEQHPAHWWTALDTAMQRLRIDQPSATAAVRAIGLSGQMHGAVLLDASDTVLRPAILWNDGRSHAQCAALEAALPALHAVAGNLAMRGFTAPKLLWVREHEPHLFARTARGLLPKDWLRLQLTGECVSDMSDASGTLWLDVGARRWFDDLLAACGLTRGWASLKGATRPVQALSLVGGGARSELWAQLLASVLGVALRVDAGAQAGAALGAARLAWLADGGQENDVCRAAAAAREFRPQVDEAQLLARRLERFRALYVALRSQFDPHADAEKPR